MPYISQQRRSQLDHNKSNATGPGDLNYQITKLCNDYLNRYGPSYNAINEVIGVLECAKIEFYRRVAVPYEDLKISENGDIYK
jgi:hypothetical protein